MSDKPSMAPVKNNPQTLPKYGGPKSMGKMTIKAPLSKKAMVSSGSDKGDAWRASSQAVQAPATVTKGAPPVKDTHPMPSKAKPGPHATNIKPTAALATSKTNPTVGRPQDQRGGMSPISFGAKHQPKAKDLAERMYPSSSKQRRFSADGEGGY